jgi:hypothetical protein
MISLKSYCEPLSQILGLTPDRLYERQRVLARTSYLTGAIAGKGPGSGIRATAANVTKLVISTLATDSLSEIDEKTRKIAAMKQVADRCPLTGEARFLKAVERLFEDPKLCERCTGIAVEREYPSGSIHFSNKILEKFRTDQSDFGRNRTRPANPTAVPVAPGRRITATLEGLTIYLIASDLEDIAEGKPPSSQIRY